MGTKYEHTYKAIKSRIVRKKATYLLLADGWIYEADFFYKTWPDEGSVVGYLDVQGEVHIGTIIMAEYDHDDSVWYYQIRELLPAVVRALENKWLADDIKVVAENCIGFVLNRKQMAKSPTNS